MARQERSVPDLVDLIVNPAAGGGRALRVLPLVTAELDALGVRYAVQRSKSLADARERAAAAAAAGHVVVAVGGDGMAGALAGVAAAAGARFGIVPAGRGNDLAGTLGIPLEPAGAARVLAGGHTRAVDLIGVSLPGQPECVVAGSVYAGIPSVAGEIANGMGWLRGPLVYPVAALRALAGWRPVSFRLAPGPAGDEAGPGPAGDEAGPGSAAGQAGPGAREFPGYAVVIANSARFGAGMRVAPPAVVDDGLLDIVQMRHGSRLAFLQVLLRIRDGTHVTLPLISLDRGAAVTLTMDRAVPAAADGETLPGAGPLPAGTPLTARALPGALTVLVPR
jgi:diacylglycerol kinase family enzyme